MSSNVATHGAATAHDEPAQIRLALNPRAMAPYLSGALGADRGVDPACYILDVKYEPGDYCTVLYRLGEQLVIGRFTWGHSDEDIPPTARLIEPLGMQVYRFEDDPALPGLRVALDPRQMAHALAEALPQARDGTLRVVRCRATPLRYRPGKRCTLRLDLWLREARTGELVPRTYFAKVYHKLDKAASVFGEMQMLCDSEPARDGRVVFAAAVAFLPGLRIVVQGPVEGTPVELYLEGFERNVTAGDRRGWDGVIRSAPALAAVHHAGLQTDRERPIEAELQRFVKRAALAETVDAGVGALLGELAAALPTWYDRLPGWGAQTTLVHGDCKPSQFLASPRGIAILDFDHCGMADPANDVGTYLATLRQLGIWQAINDRGRAPANAHKRTRWLRDLESAFLDEYCGAANKDEGFRARATWYEAVAFMRKALRAFARSPRSPMPLAEVEEAWHCLGEL
jgi:hypothetical protein